MADREKVIEALEYCKHRESNDACQCCPYPGLECALDVAAEILNTHKPRVMTLEKVNALDWDYCYLEQERLPGNEYRGMLGKYIMTCVTWPSITAAKISHGMDNYGKTWRCWTSRPTDAQREATPWSN